MRLKRVLVTGGAGFIGSHLAERLASQGAAVTVVDDLRSGSRANLRGAGGAIERIEMELGRYLDERFDPATFDAVFHLAANAYIPPSVQDPLMDFQCNPANTVRLLERLRASRRPPLLVNTSSAAVYGNPRSLPVREDDPTMPISPYGAGKLAAETYVRVYSELYGLRAASLRLFSVYGPRQRKQVAYDLLDKIRRNPQRIEVLGDGSQSRDFTFVSDVVDAFRLVAARAPARGEAYNVGSGATHSIDGLIEAWNRVLGTRPEVIYTGSLRPGDADRWIVDNSRLRELGFAPRIGLDEGLREILKWYDGQSGG